jgi:hypothetical protein
MCDMIRGLYAETSFHTDPLPRPAAVHILEYTRQQQVNQWLAWPQVGVITGELIKLMTCYQATNGLHFAPMPAKPSHPPPYSPSLAHPQPVLPLLFPRRLA